VDREVQSSAPSNFTLRSSEIYGISDYLTFHEWRRFVQIYRKTVKNDRPVPSADNLLAFIYRVYSYTRSAFIKFPYHGAKAGRLNGVKYARIYAHRTALSEKGSDETSVVLLPGLLPLCSAGPCLMGGLPSVLPRLRGDRIIARTRKTSSLYSSLVGKSRAFSRSSGERRTTRSSKPQLRGGCLSILIRARFLSASFLHPAEGIAPASE